MATVPPFRSKVDKTGPDQKEKPLEYYDLTGLTWGQLTRLSIMVAAEIGSITKPGAKKPPAVDLFRSVVLVVALMRRNIVQAAAANVFKCSQPTVSRRWDLLRPVIGRTLASFVPDPAQVLGRRGTALVDGTVCPTWDWNAIPDLFSGKVKFAGMNVQIAANLNGDVAGSGARCQARRLCIRGVRPESGTGKFHWAGRHRCRPRVYRGRRHRDRAVQAGIRQSPVRCLAR